MPSVKLSLKFVAAALTVFAAVSNAAPDTIPLAPIGDVSPAPISTGRSTFYYQVSSGAILQNGVSGPFTSGNSTSTLNAIPIAPPGQARLGTPIAACSADTGGTYNDVHVFFFAPDNLLSEWYWRPTGWQGGSGCTACIQQSGFYGVNGSQTLYAFQSAADGTVRVGFISAGSPQTLSEAVKTPTGAWSVATLPNA